MNEKKGAEKITTATTYAIHLIVCVGVRIMIDWLQNWLNNLFEHVRFVQTQCKCQSMESA